MFEAVFGTDLPIAVRFAIALFALCCFLLIPALLVWAGVNVVKWAFLSDDFSSRRQASSPPPPAVDVSFLEAISTCFKKYAEFDGRASRSEFWYWMLFCGVANGSLGTLNWKLAFAFGVAVWLPTIAVAARRLHDINKSGWWQLLAIIIPIVGSIILIIWYCRKSDKSSYRFGESGSLESAISELVQKSHGHAIVAPTDTAIELEISRFVREAYGRNSQFPTIFGEAAAVSRPEAASGITGHAGPSAGYDMTAKPMQRAANPRMASWGRTAFAVVVIGMALGGLVFIVAPIWGGEANNAVTTGKDFLSISAKRDIKGFKPGIDWAEAEASLREGNLNSKCEKHELPMDIEHNPSLLFGNVIPPKGLTLKTIACVSNHNSISLIQSFWIKPAIVMGVQYAFVDDGGGITEQIAIVEKQFGLGVPEPCTNAVAVHEGLCVQWVLEDNELQLILVEGGIFRLQLLASQSLSRRDGEAYKNSLPDKF